MENLGTRAKARREELQLSQAEVAKLAGISQTTVAQIERGRNKGSKYIVRLAAALDVSIVWLAEGEKRGVQEEKAPLVSMSHQINDNGPLCYDARRAALLTSWQRTLVENVIESLLNSIVGKQEGFTGQVHLPPPTEATIFHHIKSQRKAK